MSELTLKKIQTYCQNLQFQQFCKVVYPEFDLEGPVGYLNSKYELFKNNFIFFLADITEHRLKRLEEAIRNMPE